MPEREFVHLRTFASIWEAEVVRSRLETAGCEAHVVDQHVHYSIGAPTVQGYRLMVERKDLLKALRILEIDDEE